MMTGNRKELVGWICSTALASSGRSVLCNTTLDPFQDEVGWTSSQSLTFISQLKLRIMSLARASRVTRLNRLCRPMFVSRPASHHAGEHDHHHHDAHSADAVAYPREGM